MNKFTSFIFLTDPKKYKLPRLLFVLSIKKTKNKNMQNKGTNMRLSREAKKVKKDFDNQIKKHGKITDNYVCCPDLEDPLTWWYVIFGLEGDFEGGYYFGKVVCPQDYPARPPYITVLTKNGHFVAGEKVCLSITDYHPESWNPAWTVTHVILGMISFWLGGEETAGSQYYYGKDGMNKHQEKNMLALISQ